jgi:hypothetical protein
MAGTLLGRFEVRKSKHVSALQQKTRREGLPALGWAGGFDRQKRKTAGQ